MHRLLTRRDLYCYLAIPLVIYMAWFAVSALDKPSVHPAALPDKAVAVAYSKPTLPDKTEEVKLPIPLSDELVEALLDACFLHDVPVSLALAVMERESGFNPDAVSPSGCYGLLQLNPAYFPSGLSPKMNIWAGVGYLGELLATYDTTEAAVTAYFYGPSSRTSSEYAKEVMERVDKWESVLGQ